MHFITLIAVLHPCKIEMQKLCCQCSEGFIRNLLLSLQEKKLQRKAHLVQENESHGQVKVTLTLYQILHIKNIAKFRLWKNNFNCA